MDRSATQALVEATFLGDHHLIGYVFARPTANNPLPVFDSRDVETAVALARL
ncbi:hypothetical protein [Microbacterium sp.]|uniref:hypothetical protein n=1 Tax=Microbacterium sp. TaxID=51671 RepID=UPI003A952E3F